MRQALLLLILFVFPLSGNANSDTEGTSILDNQVINTNKVIKVGYPAPDWQPFTYVSKDQKAIGLLPSLLQEITKNAGYDIEVVIYPSYKQVLDAVKQGKIDIVMGASKTPERSTWLSFSSSLMLVPKAGITYQQDDFSLLNLQGKIIATEKGFAINELLRTHTNQVEIANFLDSQQAYKSVLNGTSDAYIGNAITLDYIHTHQDESNNLNIHLISNMPYESLHFAGLHSNELLINELDDALKAIPDETFDKLYDAWLTSSQVKYIYQRQGLNLTESELNSIRQKDTIKVLYSADNYPFAFTNSDGEMDGMSADLLKVISTKLGIKIDATEFHGQDIEKYLIENGFELIPAYTCESNSISEVQCSSAYTEDPWIAVAATNLSKMQLKSSKKIGILSKHAQQVQVETNFPSADITVYNSTKHLLNAVIAGKVNVGILPLSMSSSVISERYFGLLKVIPDPLEQQKRLVSFAINQNNPVLLSILNKAKNSIDDDELQAIAHKWNDISINSDFSFEKIPTWLFLILGGVLTVFFVIVYSNRKLKSEISQRHSVEKELRLVNSNFGGIVAQLVRYGDDIDDISWSYVSSNIEKYLGLTPEQLYKNPSILLDFLRQHADNYEFLKDIDVSRFSDSLYTTLKLTISGKTSWFQVTGVCTKVSANKHWTYTLVDITLIKEKQAELDEARLLAESATEAKSRFLAMMSHEIRTPISGILSLLELMVPHLNSKDLDGIHKNLTHSGNNLLNIVNDVLDFSKIEAGKLELSLEICQLNNFICELIQPHIAQVEAKGLKFKLWLDPKLAYSFTLDNLRLKQILNNLLNNAAKFTTEGEIWLSVDLLSETNSEQTIGFAVTDTGIGISDDDIAKLFLPFEQVDLSSERRFSGTGLGLSICEQLVKLMGGEIVVTSTYGQGSTFRLSLTCPIAAVAVPTLVNKRYGLMLTDESCSDVLNAYLKSWHCTPYNLSGIENKAALANYVAKADIELLLLPESWCEQQALTASWAKRCLPDVQIILLKNQSLLSPAPTDLGWKLSINPILPEHLLHLITNPEFFESKYAKVANDQKPLVTREQAIAANKLILVAEDHPINQDVIRMQLSKLGYFADIYDNGQQALNAYQQRDYSLLLTDCHMPELDGYGLVSAIRKQEKQQGKRLPVIALTANAMSSEKERCHQYGFDDYLIKPVTLIQLQKILDCHLVQTAPVLIQQSDIYREASLSGETKTGSKQIIDIEALEANFGDFDLCINLLKKFITTSMQDIELLDTAISKQDFTATALNAHKLKGAAGVIECERLVKNCTELETAASERKGAVVQQLFTELKYLMSQISEQVEQLK
ncbi:transporter substrate-binding domain-containing protein [Shewanella sp. 10N.261.52.F9]|uniref:transporter substrate-binding domain-containing protein n=1 Tax=Shewanella sp. 10N.261.52.F9 TaxID=3229684 RepID=UPI00354EE911